MLQCRPPLDGFLNETLQGMERSLTSSVTVCCTRQGVERSLTSLGTVVPDKGRNVHPLHGVLWYQTRGGTISIHVTQDLIVLTGGLCTTWDVILALEVTVGGR